MLKYFKPTKLSIFIWIVLFLALPLSYKGACLTYVGAYCPEWTFLGGLGYVIKFFDLVITAITSNTLPAIPILQDAYALLPPLLIILVISYLVTHLIFALVRKLKTLNL